MARFSAFASQHGETQNAIAALKPWIAGAPPRPDSYELLGRLYLLQHDADSAAVACRQALALGPDRWLPHFLLGQAARQNKQFSEAEAEYTETIRRNPRMIAAYVAASEIEMGQGQYEKAKNYLDAAKKQDPDSISANRALIQWYADRGENLEVALTGAQELKARFPEDQYLSDTLGWLYYQKRLYSLALQQLKPAASGLSENADVQYHLGMTYFQIGQQDNARTALKRALKFGLTSATAARAEVTLGELNKG
jgi:tetratricopeptide (TPR) repeat protein